MTLRNGLIIAGLALLLAALGCSAGSSSLTPTSGPTAATATAAPAQPTVTLTPAQPPAETPTLYVEPPTAIPPTAATAGQTFDAACGTGTATLSANPPRFADYATTILNTLKAHSSVQLIEQGLRAWKGVSDKLGAVQGSNDLNGDGLADLLVVVQAPPEQFPDYTFPGPDGGPGLPGDLYIYSCAGGTPVLAFADYSTTDRITPALVTTADINGDQLNEVVYTTSNCGASTCFIMPHVIEWNGTAGKFVSLFPENYAVPSGKIEIKDVDGDGVSEIVLHVGFQGSAGAGAQRSFDETYGWNGASYALKARVVTSPQFPIHFLNDADDFARKANYSAAIPLYQHVIDDQNPQVFLSQDEIPALRAYAYYRLMVAQAVNGDGISAQAAHDALAAQFANAPADAPGASFAHFADLFWSAYQPGSSAKAGCAQVITFATANPDSFALLNNFGYANFFYKPEDLCTAG